MPVDQQVPLHTLAIAQRPRKTWRQTLQAVLFALIFNFGCMMANGFQFTILLPLRLLPLPGARRLYDEGIRYSKGAFGTLIRECLLVTFRPASAHWSSCGCVCVRVPL
jgi:hypothetical protein